MGGAASGTVPKAAIGRRLVAQLLSGMNEVRVREVVELDDALPAGHAEDAAQRLITLDDMDPRARAGARGRRRISSWPCTDTGRCMPGRSPGVGIRPESDAAGVVECGMLASAGTVGGSCDNAMAESVDSAYETGLV